MCWKFGSYQEAKTKEDNQDFQHVFNLQMLGYMSSMAKKKILFKYLL